MTRAEAARHASLVRWGKEQPFAARLQAIRDARKQGKAKGGGKGKAPAKPKATPESRTAARNAEREKNTDATLTAVGMGDEAAGTLLSIAKGEGGGGDDFGLIKQGLVEKDTAGNLRLSSAGRTFVNAAARGDVGAARDSMSRGGDMVAHADDRAKAKGERDAARATAKQERDKAKAQRLAERDKTKAERDKARAEKAKAKSKGSKDEKPKEKPDKAAEAAQRRDTNRSSVQQALESAGGQSLNADAFSHLTAFADGKEADRGYLLGLAANTGLVEQDSAGGFRMTNEGRAYVSAANKGDTRAAGDAMSRAMDKLGGTATADAPEDDAPTARQQIREDKRRAGTARRRAGTAKNQARKSMSLSELLEERRAERYEIKQSAQDRAMFANMGTSKGGGGKGGGKPSGGQGGLWPVGKDGKRHAPEGGGGGGEAAPKAENGDKGHAWHPDDAHAIAKSGTQEFLGFSHENGNQSYVRTNVKPGKHEIVLQKKGGVTQSDTVGTTQLKQHLDAMHEKGYTAAKPIAKADAAPKSKPASGMSRAERDALRNVPKSDKDKPDHGEIFRDGIAASYDGIDSSGRTYRVGMGVGNVLRGNDGNYYAQANRTVHQVTNVKPQKLTDQQKRNYGNGRDAFSATKSADDAIKMTLPTDVLGLLNAQITRERFAEAAYTAIATWADAQSFPGLQAWAEAAAAEERTHAMTQIAYLNDRARVSLEPLDAPQADFGEYADALKTALTLEQTVSRALTEITRQARADGDEATALFIGGFLAEQVKAEKEIAVYVQRVQRGAPIDLLDAELFDGATT